MGAYIRARVVPEGLAIFNNYCFAVAYLRGTYISD